MQLLSSEEKMKEVARMYEETRESLNIKKGELIEALDSVKVCSWTSRLEILRSLSCKWMKMVYNSLYCSAMLQELQEEKALLTAEIDILKAGTLGNFDRGNSLFKEVEDKRKKMATAYQTLKNRYLAVQNIITKKNQEISSLKVSLNQNSNTILFYVLSYLLVEMQFKRQAI